MRALGIVVTMVCVLVAVDYFVNAGRYAEKVIEMGEQIISGITR
ncbi:MAG: hypothetical protein ACXWKC_16490 [Xanthobacteraceae bacterium]